MNIPKFLSSIVLLSGGSGVMAQKVVLPQVKISNEVLNSNNLIFPL